MPVARPECVSNLPSGVDAVCLGRSGTASAPARVARSGLLPSARPDSIAAGPRLPPSPQTPPTPCVLYAGSLRPGGTRGPARALRRTTLGAQLRRNSRRARRLIPFCGSPFGVPSALTGPTHGHQDTGSHCTLLVSHAAGLTRLVARLLSRHLIPDLRVLTSLKIEPVARYSGLTIKGEPLIAIGALSVSELLKLRRDGMPPSASLDRLTRSQQKH